MCSTANRRILFFTPIFQIDSAPKRFESLVITTLLLSTFLLLVFFCLDLVQFNLLLPRQQLIKVLHLTDEVCTAVQCHKLHEGHSLKPKDSRDLFFFLSFYPKKWFPVLHFIYIFSWFDIDPQLRWKDSFWSFSFPLLYIIFKKKKNFVRVGERVEEKRRGDKIAEIESLIESSFLLYRCGETGKLCLVSFSIPLSSFLQIKKKDNRIQIITS